MSENLEERNEIKESEFIKKVGDLWSCKCPLCGDLYDDDKVHECERVKWQIPYIMGIK